MIKIYALILFPAVSLAQIREPVQQTIFYEITHRIPFETPNKGKMELWTDSVSAFDMTWKIQEIRNFEAVHDKLIRAILYLKYKEQRAILIVINEKVLFIIPQGFDVPMIQYPHESRYYEKFD
jgi:hypothetical protein